MSKAKYFRVDKVNDPFARIDNNIFRNKKLSLKARGLLCTMLSLNEDWDYSINGLVAILKESETAVKTSLNELKECGYLEIEKTHNNRGYFSYVYVIHEKPILLPEGENPPLDNPPMENPLVENPTQLTNKIINNQLYISNKKIKKIEQLEEKSDRFFKPTLEEVESYCKEKNYDIDAQHFVDYYESKGWMVGKSKMKDWRAAVRNWNRNNFKCNQKNFSSSPSRSAKPLSDYPDYLYGEDGKLKELNEMSFEELKVYYEISDKRISGN